jgi:hypothetical protein
MANKTSTLTLAINDQFSEAQKRFTAQMNEVKKSIAEVKTEQAQAPKGGFDTNAFLSAANAQRDSVQKVSASHKDAAGSTVIFEEAQKKLQKALGSSERETGALAQAFLQLGGANNAVVASVGEALTGMGIMGVGLTALQMAITEYNGAVNKLVSSHKALADESRRTGQSVQSLAPSFLAAQDAAEAYGKQLDELTDKAAKLKLSQQTFEATKGLYGADTAKDYAKTLEEINTLIHRNDVDDARSSKNRQMSDAQRVAANDRELAEKQRLADEQLRHEQENQSWIDKMNQQQAAAGIQHAAETTARIQSLQQVQENATVRMAALDQQAADNRSQAYAAAANDAKNSLDSIIQSQIQLSQVTSKDVEDSKAGKYQDKPDENLRRTRIFQTIDTDIDKDPEAQRILNLMPEKIRSQLQQAFKEGGTKGLQLKATDLVGNMETFADTSGLDLNKVADNVQAQIEKMKNQRAMTTQVQTILKGRGIDPNSEETQKALGLETGGERAMKVNAKVNIDKAQLATEADNAKKELDKLLSSLSISHPLTEAAKTDAAGISNSGNVAGETWLGGFGGALNDGAGNVYGAFFKALTSNLDDRYIKQGGARNKPS